MNSPDFDQKGSFDSGKVSRRKVLQAAGVAAVPCLFAMPAWAAKPAIAHPPLPYPLDALVPQFSRETLEYHYGKHHAGYVWNLNELIRGTQFEGMDLDRIIAQSTGSTYNNAAQVWNHTFYWNCLSPKGGGEPTGRLREVIEQAFGSTDAFRKAFTQASMSLFGSGWVWLVRPAPGKLPVIESTGNAGCPLREGRTPLLVCDVWEHAYYIDYRNARAKYVEAFWKRVNWEFAASRSADASRG